MRTDELQKRTDALISWMKSDEAAEVLLKNQPAEDMASGLYDALWANGIQPGGNKHTCMTSMQCQKILEDYKNIYDRKQHMPLPN